jgi:hypothetical protein
MSMGKLDSCPFELGKTLKGTDADGNLINSEVLGREFTFNNIQTTSPTNGVRSFHTGEPLRVIALRNRSGVTLYGKRHATLDLTTAGTAGVTDVKGLCDALAEASVLIDPELATVGVADKDIFWGVVEGLALTLTPEAGAGFNGDIAVGADLVAATAASSTSSTTGGRVSNATFSGATDGSTVAVLRAYNLAMNHLGTALSARTTGETSADLLMRVRNRRLI